eukprot:6494262-Pyramimonas_sp.AAC.2
MALKVRLRPITNPNNGHKIRFHEGLLKRSEGRIRILQLFWQIDHKFRFGNPERAETKTEA